MRFILILVVTLTTISAPSQTYVKFEENGLMNNSNAFGALLCPVSKTVASQIFTNLQVNWMELKRRP